MPRQTQLSVVPDSLMPGVDAELYYQVPNWAAIKAIRAKLTGADWMVWAYLQMLDPHGDRLKNIPNHEEISQIVGLCEKQVKRSMQKLERMGLWETKVTTMKGRNLAIPKRKEAKAAGTKFSKKGQSFPAEGQSCSEKGQSFPKKGQSFPEKEQSCPDSSPEPAPSKASESSQTIQTYTDFLQTLSEGERVGFENFCRKETENYARPVVNLGDYLASKDSNGQPRYLDFWERFRTGAAPRAGAADAEQAWKEVLGYAARYNKYDEGTWLKSLPCSPEMKGAIGACGGLMRIGEANSSELFALKSTFKQAFCQPNQSISHQEKAYAMPAMR